MRVTSGTAFFTVLAVGAGGRGSGAAISTGWRRADPELFQALDLNGRVLELAFSEAWQRLTQWTAKSHSIGKPWPLPQNLALTLQPLNALDLRRCLMNLRCLFR